jgi:hypothetical protein
MNATELERLLSERAGVAAAVHISGGELTVAGIVSTDGEKQAALDLLAENAPGMSLVDELEVVGEIPGAVSGRIGFGTLEAGDFTAEREPEAGGEETVEEESDEGEGKDIYVPPVDPVRREDNEILGGFQVSAMDDDRVIHTEVVGGPADAGLAEAVLFELREDAATTHLRLRVACRDGIVRLRGTVDDGLDAENAEAVAARVPGVREVIDETEVRRG